MSRAIVSRGGAWRFSLPVLLLGGLLGGNSCGSCSGGEDGGGPGGGGGGAVSSGGGSWLVGQAALMVRLGHAAPEQLAHYDLDGLGEDLLGIACRGNREAWVVGAGGAMLATADAGATWRILDPGADATLRAVALADPDRVFIAGDGGVFRVSADGGASWRAPAAPAEAFTGLAARRRDGKLALLTSAEGRLHRYDTDRDLVSPVNVDGDAGRPAPGAAALWTVTLSRDGSTAVAAGAGGRFLVSRDGGASFWSVPAVAAAARGAAIRDVWLVGDAGNRFVAVGEGGLLLDGATGGEPRVRSLGAGVSLRALHLGASGHGAVVGERGAVFFTENAGETWRRVTTGEERDFFALDALESGPHL